jgi:hypothetical protein
MSGKSAIQASRAKNASKKRAIAIDLGSAEIWLGFSLVNGRQTLRFPARTGGPGTPIPGLNPALCVAENKHFDPDRIASKIRVRPGRITFKLRVRERQKWFAKA